MKLKRKEKLFCFYYDLLHTDETAIVRLAKLMYESVVINPFDQTKEYD